MTRPQINASIKEDIKHVFEELCRLEPDDIPHKIFARESKNGTHEVLSIPNDELFKLSYRDESGDATLMMDHLYFFPLLCIILMHLEYILIT